MNKSISDISQALPMIARALGDNLGVEVKQGKKACTNGKVIFVPPLSTDDKVYEGKHFSAYDIAKSLGIGRIVHEAGHIRYTDFNLEVEDGFTKHMLNLLEDIREEKAIMNDFPGTRDDLNKMCDVLTVDGFWEVPGDDASPNVIIQSWILFKLRREVLGQTAFDNILPETEALFNKTVPEGAAIKLEALIFEVEKAKSTMDCLILSHKILQMLEEEAEKEEEKEQEPPDQDSGDSQDQQQDQTQSSSDSSKGDQDDDDSDQQQDGQSGSGDGDAEQTEQGSQSSKKGQSGQNGDDSDDASNPDGNAGNNGGGHGGKAASEVLKEIINAAADDGIKDLGEGLTEYMDSIAEFSANNVVANTIDDVAQGDAPDFSNEVASAVNALQHKLHGVLQTQTRQRITSKAMGTKILTNRLHTVKMGGNVFAKKSKTIKIDTAVQLLMDISGSMSTNNKLEVAKKAAYALASALEKINGVEVGVAAFPGVDSTGWLAVKRLTKIGQPLRGREKNFLSLSVTGNTPLSESIASIAYDLAARKEPRKVLFVTTDGAPDDFKAAKEKIELLERSGIEVCGIGIMHDVSRLFRIHTSISSVDELSGAMFSMMQDVILKAA